MKICKIFGHKWKYGKKNGMKHRECMRKNCKYEQWGHPYYIHEGGEINLYGYYYNENPKDDEEGKENPRFYSGVDLNRHDRILN